MIGRLTDTEPEDWPTVDTETLVRRATEDGADICDVAPIGWYGASFYPEDGLLILTYRKNGESFAGQEDEEGELAEEHADTGLGFLTVDRVVELVHSSTRAAGFTWSTLDAERWVLERIEHSQKLAPPR
jgi:hypothetical protein